jgi:phage baseplate assembly protein W
MKRYNAFYVDMVPDLQESRGAGLSIAPSGGIAMVDDHLSIRQSILIILSTIPGERVMRPDFGCDLYKLVFSPNDATTAGLAIHYVRRALTLWEKRITLLDIDAGPGAVNPEILEISLRYRILTGPREEHMIYSFDISGKEA